MTYMSKVHNSVNVGIIFLYFTSISLSRFRIIQVDVFRPPTFYVVYACACVFGPENNLIMVNTIPEWKSYKHNSTLS